MFILDKSKCINITYLLDAKIHTANKQKTQSKKTKYLEKMYLT